MSVGMDLGTARDRDMPVGFGQTLPAVNTAVPDGWEEVRLVRRGD